MRTRYFTLIFSFLTYLLLQQTVTGNVRAQSTNDIKNQMEQNSRSVVYDFDFDSWCQIESDSIKKEKVRSLTTAYLNTLEEFRITEEKEAKYKLANIVTIVGALFLVLVFFFWKVLSQSRLKKELSLIKTEKQKREKEDLEILHQYFSNLSHEIRTPLNGIAGMAELLSSTNLSEKQEEYLNILTSSANNLMANVTDLIEFNRAEQAASNADELPFDLHDIINQVIDMAADKASEKRIHLSLYTDTRIPQTVIGDAVILRHVLSLLIRNAVDRSEYKDAGLRVEQLQQNNNRTELRFTVFDSGKPYPFELNKSLSVLETPAESILGFLDQHETARMKTALHFLKIINATYGIESHGLDGVHFWFTIKLDIAQVRQVEAAKMSLSNIRVLIIDENQTSRAIFRQYLSYFGCRFDESSNIDEGFNKLLTEENQVPYHYAIINIRMVGSEIREKISQFKSTARGENTKIILISTSGFILSPAELKHGGIAAYLNKPVRISDLYYVLSSLTEIKQYSEKKPEIPLTTGIDNGLSILLAEDNLISEKVAVATLTRLGHTVDVAENGKVVLQKLNEKRYDLILMDIEMPVMNGIETTVAIRNSNITGSDGKPVKIIALTANAMPTDREKCLNSGMDGYISKPFKHEELIEALSSKY